MAARTRLAGFAHWHETVLAVLILGLLLLAWRIEPAFVRLAAQLDLSTHIFELALLAVPMTLIIITGGIDLSVGSTMALAAVVLGLLYEAHVPWWIGVVAALATGLAAGALNGVFVAHLRVHPLIVTLATFSAYRGIAEGISLGRPISGFPESFGVLGRGECWGVPIPGWVFIVALAAGALLLARTPLGRSIYAIGFNETACRFSGIAVDRIKLGLYALSGLAAAIAGVLFVARRNTAKADVGTNLELEVITAVVLGGASVFGGRGRMLGTLLGVLLIHETREFVSWHWQNDELILVVVGALLIVSVLLNSLVSGKRAGRES